MKKRTVHELALGAQGQVWGCRVRQSDDGRVVVRASVEAFRAGSIHGSVHVKAVPGGLRIFVLRNHTFIHARGQGRHHSRARGVPAHADPWPARPHQRPDGRMPVDRGLG